jgi:hypothetical protein
MKANLNIQFIFQDESDDGKKIIYKQFFIFLQLGPYLFSLQAFVCCKL